ncbi:hypothetical protein CGCF415_v012706 [Colletotrichum fructicola]|nr:hypothetical protein CGCF415_v012706 [Colletotrichum fructicola]KAF4928424.1 hypothetical protein CGCF245_v012612 [Colletotrichum fructicola]
MACVQLNHDIPHRNRFHPGNYILHNCWYGVLKSLQGLHVDKSHLGCSNWQHYRHWCINRNGVSNRHHSLAKCELYVELSTERDCLSGQRDNYEYVNVECDFQNRGHRRSHSDRNLFYCQFYETITFLTTLPVGELLSSSEHNHYYLWNRHHGNIDIDGRYFQYQLYHLLVAASIPGHELYFISVYLGQHNGGTITGLPTPTTEPPFPTRNRTSTAGPTGTAPPEGSGTVFFTTEPPETSSGLNATATTPPFPAGNVTIIPVSTGNVTVTLISSAPSGAVASTLTITRADRRTTQTLTVLRSATLTPPFPTSNGTLVPTATGTGPPPGTVIPSVPFSQLPNSTFSSLPSLSSSSSLVYPSTGSSTTPATATNSTRPTGSSTPCHTVTVTSGTVTQVITKSVLVSSMPTCTSKWQNTTFTKSSTGATNRTSSNTATTLITSTTKTSVSAEGDSTTMFEPDGPVVPTTTVSDFTLPSNKAYPWGGNGPLFRRPNTTATDSENVAVRQPGGWWLRWKRHFDRSRSSAKDRGADVTHET